MSYLSWLEENWQQGRPYLHCVAILDSARKRLAKEEAEIARLEAGESVEEPSSFNMDILGVGRIMEGLWERTFAGLEVGITGGDLDEAIERRRIGKWERQAVEAAEKNRRLAGIKREYLREFYGKHVDEALQERDACVFEDYPRDWLGADADKWERQLADRFWALGWLGSPSHFEVSELGDALLWFMDGEDWNASIRTHRYRIVAQLSPPNHREDLRKLYKTVTRCVSRNDNMIELLQRTMLTFIDLNFDCLRRDYLFNSCLEEFQSRTIEDWP